MRAAAAVSAAPVQVASKRASTVKRARGSPGEECPLVFSLVCTAWLLCSSFPSYHETPENV